MCGIVGFNGNDTGKLAAMLTSIHHRGPDDQGLFEDKKCSLGHVRLSILDLSSHGHQPMYYEHLRLVYNGEVYNYREIRKELITFGYNFDSDSDTEVILKAYHYWGIEAVDRFIGMFAIAIYDALSSKIILLRDRVGVKPLYYLHEKETFVFASELKPIMQFKEDLKINEEALETYMRFGYISSNLSIFKHCKKLPAGHYGIYDLQSNYFEIKSYWSILDFYKLPKFQKSEEELIDELETLLIDAFKYRMVSDVPVGVFLSGGIDSSVVAAILQKHYGNIHTFTIGFNEAKYNEAKYAKEIASYLGTEHTEKYLGANDAKKILEHFVDIYDEPFADSSGIPTTMVCKVAKDAGIKVVLSADGGDEIFCGYSRYMETYKQGKMFFSIPYVLRKVAVPILNMLCYVFPSRSVQRKLKVLQTLLPCQDWQEFYNAKISFLITEENNQILHTENRVIRDRINVASTVTPIEQMMLIDYHHYMVDDILTKVDRATMSVSIEGREPLLDHRISEFMAQVPFEYKYKNGETKYLLKKVLERYLPKEMIYRPKKGFAIPMQEWFEQRLQKMFETYLSEEKLDEHNLFAYPYIQKIYSDFKQSNSLNTTNKLWFILVFQLWYKKYMNKKETSK